MTHASLQGRATTIAVYVLLITTNIVSCDRHNRRIREKKDTWFYGLFAMVISGKVNALKVNDGRHPRRNFSSRCVSHRAQDSREREIRGNPRVLSRIQEKEEAPKGLGVCAPRAKRRVDVRNEYKFWRENANVRSRFSRHRHRRDYPIRGCQSEIFPNASVSRRNEAE